MKRTLLRGALVALLSGPPLVFANESGSGGLTFIFDPISPNFSIQFDTGEFDFVGTAENGEADYVFHSFAFEVAEPGTLALFGLGLLGVGLTRRRRR